MQYFVVPLYHAVLCTFKIHDKRSVPVTNGLTNLKRDCVNRVAYISTLLPQNLQI